MTKRNIEIKVRLSRKEAENLNKQVKKCRLSREAYLRHLITGEVPREAPPPEYFAFMREMHYVGHNLNQIAQKAHVLNVVDAKRYDEDSKRLDKLIREVTAAVVLPAKWLTAWKVPPATPPNRTALKAMAPIFFASLAAFLFLEEGFFPLKLFCSAAIMFSLLVSFSLL